MDTRLAVLGIIHFRHFLSETLAVKPYCSSGSLEVALWAQHWCSPGVRPHSPGIHRRSSFVPCPGGGLLASGLPITEVICEGCGAPVDIHGYYRAACMKTGRVKRRAVPTERVLARVFRKAGARVRFSAFFRGPGSPLLRGCSIGSRHHDVPCNGEAQAQAENIDCAVWFEARHDKERCYPERCRLVVASKQAGVGSTKQQNLWRGRATCLAGRVESHPLCRTCLRRTHGRRTVLT